MRNDAVRSREEIRELLLHLQQFYGQPVLPLDNFCHAFELWMDCIVKNNTDPALHRDGIKHGHIYFEFLNLIRIDIRKSNFLGRLLFAREPLRTRMCPIHKGHFNAGPCFLRNAHSCAMGPDGSGSARKIGGTPESKSLRRRDQRKTENSNSRIRGMGNGKHRNSRTTVCMLHGSVLPLASMYAKILKRR
jgi:hypothetical protein